MDVGEIPRAKVPHHPRARENDTDPTHLRRRNRHPHHYSAYPYTRLRRQPCGAHFLLHPRPSHRRLARREHDCRRGNHLDHDDALARVLLCTHRALQRLLRHRRPPRLQAAHLTLAARAHRQREERTPRPRRLNLLRGRDARAHRQRSQSRGAERAAAGAGRGRDRRNAVQAECPRAGPRAVERGPLEDDPDRGTAGVAANMDVACATSAHPAAGSGADA